MNAVILLSAMAICHPPKFWQQFDAQVHPTYQPKREVDHRIHRGFLGYQQYYSVMNIPEDRADVGHVDIDELSYWNVLSGDATTPKFDRVWCLCGRPMFSWFRVPPATIFRDTTYHNQSQFQSLSFPYQQVPAISAAEPQVRIRYLRYGELRPFKATYEPVKLPEWEFNWLMQGLTPKQTADRVAQLILRVEEP